LSNEHGSLIKDQGQWQCCLNKHKKFPYQPTRDVSLLSGHTSYIYRLWMWPTLFKFTTKILYESFVWILHNEQLNTAGFWWCFI
jgi:hypothetical protein